MTQEVLKLALEALKMLHDENFDYLTRNKLGGENNQCMVFAREAITAIKAALAQPKQEPVAWMDRDGNISDNNDHKCFPIPLYTTPNIKSYSEKDNSQPAQKRNFCPRCGKRVGDYIHTCTPPQEKYTYGTPLLDAMTKDYLSPQRTWVGLTDEELLFLHGHDSELYYLIKVVEAKLRSKNT